MTSTTSSLDRLLAHAESAPNTKVHGDRFELISDFALRNSPAYGHAIKTIERYETWAKRERPELRGQSKLDNGVDRIITTHSGEIWAVQNKGYARTAENNLGELANFVMQGRDIAGASKLIWVTSGRGLNRKSAAANQDSGANVVVHNYDWLNGIDGWPDDFADLRVVKPAAQPFTLYPEQQLAVERVTAELSGTRAAQFISACGTGKTITMHAMHEALDSELTAFFVPTLGLMRQTIRSWRRQAGNAPLNVLAVCSDSTVLSDKADHLEFDEQALGERLYRTPADLAAALAQRGEQTYVDAAGVTQVSRTVVFSTYHSSWIVAEAQHDHGADEFDFVVADEAHYLAGKGSFGEAVKEKPDGGIRVRAQKRVYATATPRVASEKLKERGMDSMDADSPVFGRQAHTLTFGEAIALERLSSYTVSIVVVPDAEAIRAVERNVTLIDGRMNRFDARSYAAALAVREAINGGDKRVVSYHHTVRGAKNFADTCKELGVTGFAETITGKVPAGERDRIIAQLETEPTGLITNVRCLNEGVDIPSLDAVMFVDPKSKVEDIVQSIGRVLRKHPGKQRGHIIIPIPISEADYAAGLSVEGMSELMRTDESWKTAFHVLKAMGEHDTVILDQIDDLAYAERSTANRRDLLTTGKNLIDRHAGGNIELTVLGSAGAVPDVELMNQLAQGLRLATVRELSPAWTTKYLQLRNWLNDHDGEYPTHEDNASLRTWVNTQKSSYNTGTLTPERHARLEHLPGWALFAETEHQRQDRHLDEFVAWGITHMRAPQASGDDEEQRHHHTYLAAEDWMNARGLSREHEIGRRWEALTRAGARA